MRLKVQTLKSLLWFGNALAAAAILFLLADLVMNVRVKAPKEWRIDEKELQKAMAVKPTIESRERGTGINWSQLESLHKLNVTGKEPPPPPENVTTPDSPQPLKPIADVLQVNFITYFSNDSTQCFAQVHYKEDGPVGLRVPEPAVPYDPRVRSKVRTLANFHQVGDSLRAPYDKEPFNGKILDILEDSVKFSWGGEEVVLTTPQLANASTVSEMSSPDGGADAAEGAEPKKSEPKPPPAPAASRESRQISENEWFLGTDELTRLEKEGEALFNEIAIGTIFSKSENRPRLSLTKVPEGTLAWQRGFREQDILRRIDDEEISSKSFIVEHLKKHANRSRVTLEIERMGTRITKTFQLAR